MQPHVIWDLFISHASEDKATIAEPLYQALTRAGLKVWFDKTELLLGDSLLRKINDGLVHSRYGLVILSPAFFAKKWPQHELAGLFSLEEAGHPKILPIWHELGQPEIAAYCPIMAGRLAVETSNGLDRIVTEILRRLRAASTRSNPTPPAAPRPFPTQRLSQKAMEILKIAVEMGGYIIAGRFDVGFSVSVGQHFFGDVSPRSLMSYKAAFEELCAAHFVDHCGKDVYQVNDRGYGHFDQIFSSANAN